MTKGSVRRRPIVAGIASRSTAVAGMVCALLVGMQSALPDERKPNVVLILVDDMGWADVGYNGSKLYETPNIDRLAQQGMTFAQAYTSPLCSPTRASLLTGKNPARLHLTDAIHPMSRSMSGKTAEKVGSAEPYMKVVVPGFVNHLPLGEVTVAEVLKREGYVTGIFGKWHLGEAPSIPENHGFDVAFGYGTYPPPPDYFYPYGMGSVPDGKPEEYLTDRLTDESEKFLEDHKDKPFFLFLSHYGVHLPLQAKKPLVARYQAKVDPDASQNNPTYAAMIHSVDESVGRITAKLDGLELSHQTVVIFMSDNGGVLAQQTGLTVTSNAPLREGKGTLYEGGIRVPMTVRWPDVVAPGSVCNTPVVSDDLYPTFMEIAKGEDPADPLIDGESIVPLLENSGTLSRESLQWHFPHYPASSAIRLGNYKLIEFYGEGVELYNLIEDVGETSNLAEALPETASSLQRKLRAWLKEVGAWMPIPNPAYDPATQEPPMSPFLRHASFMLNRRVRMEEVRAVMRQLSRPPIR